MAEWRDHPYHTQHYMLVWQPEIVFEAQVDTTSATATGVDTYTGITVKNVTTGATTDLKRGMTVAFGTIPRAWDRGSCRVRYDITSPGSTFSVWVPPGRKRGEIDPQTDTYITIYNDYRPWYKPPYSLQGTIYKDGPGIGTTTEYPYQKADLNGVGPPKANGGIGYATLLDDGDSAALLDFDGSNSFSLNPNGEIITYSYISTSGASISASTENGSHTADKAFDIDSGTYWEATTTTGWIEVDWSPATKTPRKVAIKEGTTGRPGTPFTIQYHNGSTWVTVKTAVRILGSSAFQNYYIFDADKATASRWRINMTTPCGGSALRLTEVEFHEEHASNDGHSWDYDDATPGTATGVTQSNVSFPIGKRWIHYTVSDTFELEGTHHIPIAVCGRTFSEVSYTGATKTASSGTAANAFDNSTATAWVTTPLGTTTGWLKIQFASAITFDRYGVQMGTSNLTRAPNTWIVYISDDDVTYTEVHRQTGQTSWSSTEERAFSLPYTVTATYIKIEISANDGDPNFLQAAEFNIYAVASELLPIEDFEIEPYSINAQGQEWRIRVYEDLDTWDYPPGSFVQVWEREVHGGTVGSLEGPSGREHMVFQGWIFDEQIQSEVGETDTRSHVALQCLDIAGWLRQFPAHSVVVSRDAYPPDFGFDQASVTNIDTFTWYLLYWHSTALSLAEFYLSGTGETYAYPRMLANQASNLWNQASAQPAKIGYLLTCDRWGRLHMIADENLLASGSRTSTIQETLDEDDYSDMGYAATAFPRIHWHWGDGVAVDTKDADDPTWSATAYVTVKPGLTPGQGAGASQHGRQLVVNQAELDTREGNRADVRANAPYSRVSLELVHSGDLPIDPAATGWVKLPVTDTLAAKRRYLVPLYKKVLTRVQKAPIAYWRLNEPAGSAQVRDSSGNAYHVGGSDLSNVTLGATGLGDGHPAASFNGSNSYARIDDIDPSFDGAEGTILAWFQVSGAGVWSDASSRYVAICYVDSSNYVLLYKTTTTGQFTCIYRAGGTSDSVSKSSITTTDPVAVALTWSATDDEVKMYWQGAQEGSTQTGLGTWAGSLSPSSAIGALGGGTNVFSGVIGHVAIFDVALTGDEIAYLSADPFVRMLPYEVRVAPQHRTGHKLITLLGELEGVGVDGSTYTP